MRKEVYDNMSLVGANIKTARVREGLTQEALAKSINVTSQYLSDVERGLTGVSISTLVKLCTKLNVTSDFILFGKEDKSFHLFIHSDR